jgi:hypothetical protein
MESGSKAHFLIVMYVIVMYECGPEKEHLPHSPMSKEKKGSEKMRKVSFASRPAPSCCSCDSRGSIVVEEAVDT